MIISRHKSKLGETPPPLPAGARNLGDEFANKSFLSHANKMEPNGIGAITYEHMSVHT